jgi:hypothetical protein
MTKIFMISSWNVTPISTGKMRRPINTFAKTRYDKGEVFLSFSFSWR